LTEAGVKRISFATSLFRAAMTSVMAAATEVKDRGTFTFLDHTMATPEWNKFMAGYVRGRSRPLFPPELGDQDQHFLHPAITAPLGFFGSPPRSPRPRTFPIAPRPASSPRT